MTSDNQSDTGAQALPNNVADFNSAALAKRARKPRPSGGRPDVGRPVIRLDASEKSGSSTTLSFC
jgi:hypothetical protein